VIMRGATALLLITVRGEFRSAEGSGATSIRIGKALAGHGTID